MMPRPGSVGEICRSVINTRSTRQLQGVRSADGSKRGDRKQWSVIASVGRKGPIYVQSVGRESKFNSEVFRMSWLCPEA